MRGIPALFAATAALAVFVSTAPSAAAATGEFRYVSDDGPVVLQDPPDDTCIALDTVRRGLNLENRTDTVARLYPTPSCVGSPQVVPPGGLAWSYRPIRAVEFSSE
ncbi:hypothetical protein [Actinokineospora enzanensis]|uniref:hypothetical protein n=1 Tax=Actinokineospora enzanensis TaxID=155975 RepID=UPI00037D8C5D|nr:hypothetical protein [Actinokineospora enzanensis]